VYITAYNARLGISGSSWISGGRCPHGGAEARREKREETATRHKGNWRVPSTTAIYIRVQRKDMAAVAPRRRPLPPHFMHLYRRVLTRSRPAASPAKRTNFWPIWPSWQAQRPSPAQQLRQNFLGVPLQGTAARPRGRGQPRRPGLQAGAAAPPIPAPLPSARPRVATPALATPPPPKYASF
jgi:hypothetical protein